MIEAIPGLLFDIVPLAHRALRWWGLRKAKALFGNDIDTASYFLVWPLYRPQRAGLLKPKPQLEQHVHYMAGTQPEVAASAEVRAIAYLSKALGDLTGTVPQIVHDVEVETRMDLSFISLGGMTNYKTQDCLRNRANTLVEMNENGIRNKRDGSILAAPTNEPKDFGVILKVCPAHQSGRTWICCAGIADWGTSGAAYFLANHWKELHAKARKKPFACVTQTEQNSDESTQPVCFLSD